jgi:hypothetical protein
MTVGDGFDGPVITNRDENSRAAAESVQPYASSQRRRVWLLINRYPRGLACWEVEEITGGLHQSVSATINWLYTHKWLVRDGKNKTPSGRSAHIYRAVKGGWK